MLFHSKSSPESAADRIGLELSPDGRIVHLSDGWLAMAQGLGSGHLGSGHLGSERLLGRPLTDFLSDAAAAELAAFLASAEEGHGPPGLGPDFAAWTPWPSSHGVKFHLTPAARERLSDLLRRPIFLADSPRPESQLEALNEAGRELQRREPAVRRVADFDAWLVPFGFRARPSSTWRCAGRPILIPAADSLHGVPAFQLLSRTLRSALHDVSNPMSAVRMVAEVAARGISDPTRHLSGIARHLDTATAILQSVRSVVQTESRARPLDAAALMGEAVGLLRSEAERRDITLRADDLTAPEPEIEGSRSSFLLLCLGLLLRGLGFAGEGDCWNLSATCDEEEWVVEGRLEAGAGPRPLLPDPEIDGPTLRRLAAPFQGRLELAADGSAGLRLTVPLL